MNNWAQGYALLNYVFWSIYAKTSFVIMASNKSIESKNTGGGRGSNYKHLTLFGNHNQNLGNQADSMKYDHFK